MTQTALTPTSTALARPTPPPASFPLFTGDASEIPPALSQRMWRPIVKGAVVFGVFVFGTFSWAAIFPIAGAVIAPSFLRVEDNRKVIKHRDGGIIKTVRVREGVKVSRGDLLIELDDTQTRGVVDVLRGQLDSYLAQRARFLAERDSLPAVTFPEELTARKADSVVQVLLQDQQGLFATRLRLMQSGIEIQKQKIQQVETRIGGLQAQIASVNLQHKLISEELEGTKFLFEKGLATKAKYLALQRAAADLEGQKGSLLADVTRSREAVGEANIQIAQLQQQRVTESSEGLREVQVRIADTIPRLRAGEETLAQVEIRAPVDGFVHSLTQFTDGGVIAASERLLDLVPADSPLIVEARIRPEDISKVGPDMEAQVRLTAYKARVVPTIPATVTKVSADRMTDAKTGEAYFTAELRISPDELKSLAPSVRLYPGMPAESMIATGERTVLDYLVTPFTGGLATAMREH